MKIGPCWNSKNRLPVLGFHHHVRAEDVGRHQVGRKLDAVELQAQRFGQRADQQGFAQARHAFQQAMPSDEQASQNAVDDVVVSDDNPADLLAYGRISVDELAGAVFHGFSNAHGESLFRLIES